VSLVEPSHVPKHPNKAGSSKPTVSIEHRGLAQNSKASSTNYPCEVIFCSSYDRHRVFFQLSLHVSRFLSFQSSRNSGNNIFARSYKLFLIEKKPSWLLALSLNNYISNKANLKMKRCVREFTSLTSVSLP